MKVMMWVMSLRRVKRKMRVMLKMVRVMNLRREIAFSPFLPNRDE